MSAVKLGIAYYESILILNLGLKRGQSTGAGVQLRNYPIVCYFRRHLCIAKLAVTDMKMKTKQEAHGSEGGLALCSPR